MADRKQLRRAKRLARLADNDTEATRKKRSFHRGEVVNYHPRREDFRSEKFIQDYLLKGWLPSEPFLTKGMKITAFGSCFAANITRHLSSIGYDLSSNRDPDVYISRLGAGMVNTAAILGQFEWAFEGKKQAENLWHGQKAEGYGYDEDIRTRTRDIFLGTEFFIITLGLSEVWYDSHTGGTFWRAVPENAFDPSRHKFRVMSMAETKADIAHINALIRKYVPRAKILFTVSPIPLAATFRPVSCLTANLVSKSIIRAALDEFLRENENEINDRLFYFPSMELVMLGFIDPWDKDARHPQSYAIDTVMKAFEAAFCHDSTSIDDVNRELQMYRIKNTRDIVRREGDAEEQTEILKLAKKANRQSKLARSEAKDRQAILGGVAKGIVTEEDRLDRLRQDRSASRSG